MCPSTGSHGKPNSGRVKAPAAWAGCVALASTEYPALNTLSSAQPYLQIVGGAVSLLLVFRTNTAYGWGLPSSSRPPALPPPPPPPSSYILLLPPLPPLLLPQISSSSPISSSLPSFSLLSPPPPPYSASPLLLPPMSSSSPISSSAPSSSLPYYPPAVSPPSQDPVSFTSVLKCGQVIVT